MNCLSALPTLPALEAAPVYKLLKEREAFLAMEGGFGMAPFGAYRIVVGMIFLSLALAGRITFGS